MCFILEKRYFGRNGHVLGVLLTVSLIPEHDSTPRFVISPIQDISARIKVEAE
jgi:PAS domain S-box-containing protein